jgi:lysophospholipase L1-like esterase
VIRKLLMLICVACMACADPFVNMASAHDVIPTSDAFYSADSASSFEYEQSMRFIGRFDRRKKNQLGFTWAGSAFEFNFEGTHAEIKLSSDRRIRFEVKVDGVASDLWVDGKVQSYVLASALDAGVHHIRVTRLTEPFDVISAIHSVPKVEGQLLAPPGTPKRRLLVIGDSISAGYGVEGKDQSCHYSMETSNQQLGYAALAADTLNADLHSIAWSGIGIWRSYSEKYPINPTIYTRYQRTLADDHTSKWDVAGYQASAIMIAIGTNDFWDGNVTEQYKINMLELIALLKSQYPSKPIFLIVSPLLVGKVRDSHKSILESISKISDGVVTIDIGVAKPKDGFGCDYHPSEITQRRMSEYLVDELKVNLNW